MLSYRHSFHAGNFADILKHIVAVDILCHLRKKDAPFEYFDSHAGAGLFDLSASHAQKLQEYRGGIGKLKASDYPELSDYFAALAACNKDDERRFYPGSPSIAKYFLRTQDRAWLYELHPQDYQLLQQHLAHKKIRVFCEEGLAAVVSKMPPTSRRGFVLIDPSYEVKTEYDVVVKTLKQAYKKFASGIYALWYPVVDRRKIDALDKKLIHSGITNIQRFELAVRADSSARGMTSSGMIVINPPWTLRDKMNQVLPRLVQTLGEDSGAFFTSEVLVAE